MKLPIPPISQKNPLWKYSKLGFSSLSIGSYGCVLCVHTMIACYYGYNHNPLTLNELYKEKGIYLNQNLIDFWGIPKAFPNIKPEEFIQCPDVPASLDLIDKYLDEQKPVIALVDFDKATQGLQSHFVLIIGKEGSDYLINDPESPPPGETYFFSAKYGEPSKGIYGLRLYSGPVNTKFQLMQGGILINEFEKNPQDVISDLEDKLKTTNDSLAGKALEANELRGMLEKQTTDNNDLGKQLLEARSQRDSATRQATELERRAREIQGTLDNALTEISGLKALLVASQAEKISMFSGWQLIAKGIAKLIHKNGVG